MSAPSTWSRAGHDISEAIHPSGVAQDTTWREIQPIYEPDLLCNRCVEHELHRRPDSRSSTALASGAIGQQMPVSLEELVIALADKLWKGARKSELVGETGQVIAFEMDEPLAARARENLRLWPWARVESARRTAKRARGWPRRSGRETTIRFAR